MKIVHITMLSIASIGSLVSMAHAQKAREAEAVAVATGDSAAKPKVRPLTVTVDLTSNVSIGGTIMDANQLTMKTSFGEATIPMTEIAGIRFASSEDVSTTVVMLNGDSITGATDVKVVTVDTEWGTAKINGSNIKSIMFVPSLTWNAANGLNGKRWSLTENRPASPVPPAPAQPNTPNRQFNQGIQSGRAVIGQ